jgi:MFS family permease
LFDIQLLNILLLTKLVMNNKLAIWSITVGLGGFLFGLDVAVISGAEQAIQQLWSLSDWMHGTAIAMALYGTAFGAGLGNIPANKIGRKQMLPTLYIFCRLRVPAAPFRIARYHLKVHSTRQHLSSWPLTPH